MEYRGRKYLIGQIGYENDPVQIRRAFKQGCGGVIVEGTVPEKVVAELSRVTPEILKQLHPVDPDKSLLPPSFTVRLEYEAAKKRGNWIGKSASVLDETCRWLQEEAEWAITAGFRPPLEQMNYHFRGVRPAVIRGWFLNDVVRAWHIDKTKPMPWRDVHIHVQGEGMLVASRSSPARLRFDDAFNLAAGNKMDEFLEEKGFSLVQLQPGQKLIFSETCLHRSSQTSDDTMKFRAAMF